MYSQSEEVIFTVNTSIHGCFHQVVEKHAGRLVEIENKTRQEIGSDLPVLIFHPVLDRRTKCPPHIHDTSLARPSAFKRFNLLPHQNFQRTYNEHNAI